jgi:hypothetical protein
MSKPAANTKLATPGPEIQPCGVAASCQMPLENECGMFYEWLDVAQRWNIGPRLPGAHTGGSKNRYEAGIRRRTY